MNMNDHSKNSAESGQALVEYSFVLVLVALVCFVAIGLVGDDVASVFGQVAGGFPGA